VARLPTTIDHQAHGLFLPSLETRKTSMNKLLHTAALVSTLVAALASAPA